MRLPFLIVVMLSLAGCTLGTHQQAATPPPPKPAAAPAPAQEAQLSIPQTSVTLPSQQEFNPDSIPKVPVAQEPAAPDKVEAPPPARTSKRGAASGGGTGATQKSDPEPDTDAPPAPAVQEQAPIQPILGDEEQRKIKGVVENRKKEIGDRLKRANANKGVLSPHDRSLVDRINAFLAQCEQAEKRGDYSQADALSERAVVLAKELSE